MRLLLLSLVLISVSRWMASAAAPGGATTLSPAWQRLERYTVGFAHPGSQLKDYVYARSADHFARGDAQRDAIRTPEALRARQAELRHFFVASLGGLPASDTPLNARVTGTVQGNGYSVEKVIFEARPRHYVTANLYLPATRTGRTGAVLFLSGHHANAKQAREYQSVCQTLVQAGLIVLSQDPIGQGERFSYYDAETKQALIRAGTGEHDHAGAQARLVGDQIARYFLHDAMRGVDYLLTRPEVDPARIGVTGNSGGGTQTSLMMLADPRIAAAAPGTFITSRPSYLWTGQPQDAEQNWFGFTAAGYDHEDILLAMAPKPVCVLAVRWDFFPIEGTRETVTRARRAWNLFDQGEALELIEDDSIHSYTPRLARAAARFFSRHLLGREVDPGVFPPQPVPDEKLFATRTGQVRGELPNAEFVFEANLARFDAIVAARRQTEPAITRQRALEWLRARVTSGRVAVDANPRFVERGTVVDDLVVDVGFWWSQPRLANLGMLFRAKDAQGAQPLTIALWDEGSQALSRHAAWVREECGRGRAVLVINLCGVGPMKPDPINARPDGLITTYRKLADDLSFLGDSLVALRTFEVLRALDVVATWPGFAVGPIRIHAHGRMGLHGRLAAAIDPRVSTCEWSGAFRFADIVRNRNYDSTDIKSILLPGALRYFDLDEL